VKEVWLKQVSPSCSNISNSNFKAITYPKDRLKKKESRKEEGRELGKEGRKEERKEGRKLVSTHP
jgi:hypothetical protein